MDKFLGTSSQKKPANKNVPKKSQAKNSNNGSAASKKPDNKEEEKNAQIGKELQRFFPKIYKKFNEKKEEL